MDTVDTCSMPYSTTATAMQVVESIPPLLSTSAFFIFSPSLLEDSLLLRICAVQLFFHR